MKVYCAGKTQDLDTVRRVQALCRLHGHKITHDWTEIVEEVGGRADERGIPPERQKRYAYYDVMGVYNCDLVIACGHPNLAGTFIEVGLGIAWHRPIWLFNWHLARQTVFQHLENFRMIETITELNQALEAANPQRIAMEPAAMIMMKDAIGQDITRLG